jgi:hypothetical protein
MRTKPMDVKPTQQAAFTTESDFTGDCCNLKEAVLRELLRQAHHSYNLALAVTAGSALITLAGVGLLYLEKIPAASLTTAGGAIASIGCIQVARECKEELRQMMEQLSQ